MLQAFCYKRTHTLLNSGLKTICRFESNDLGWENIKSIKANKWPVLKGEATADKTKLVKSNYLKKRLINTVPKTGWEVSALGYGKGGSRIYNDDWSGEMQRACRFGTNLLQLTIGEEFLDENYSGNPAGFIHPHGMLHGLLTCDNIPRGSMVVTSKIYSHQRNGQAYSAQTLQKMVDISLTQMGVDKLDMLTLEIPPFITETQLAMALYHIKSEISNGRVNYFTIGGTFPFTADGFNPLSGVAKKDRPNVDMSKFSFSFIKLMRIIKDVGLMDKLIGVEIPLNASEAEIATKPLETHQLHALEEYMHSAATDSMTLLDVMKKCDLAIFADRCFEGYQDQRPVRLIDLKQVKTDNLLESMKEAFEICRYLEDVYRQDIRPSIQLPEGHAPVPDPDTFQFGYVLPTIMNQAGALMVWDDLKHTAIEPNIREGINQLAGISEEVKKWCFSYRLATSNMMNYITTAFKAKEIAYIQKVDRVVNELCPAYANPSFSFDYKMLDSILSLGVTSVITDMIHIHAKDVLPPLLTESESKAFLSKLRMPEDDVHLINMEDYQFKKQARDVRSMREANAYVHKPKTTKEQ